MKALLGKNDKASFGWGLKDSGSLAPGRPIALIPRWLKALSIDVSEPSKVSNLIEPPWGEAHPVVEGEAIAILRGTWLGSNAGPEELSHR